MLIYWSSYQVIPELLHGRDSLEPGIECSFGFLQHTGYLLRKCIDVMEQDLIVGFVVFFSCRIEHKTRDFLYLERED